MADLIPLTCYKASDLSDVVRSDVKRKYRLFLLQTIEVGEGYGE